MSSDNKSPPQHTPGPWKITVAQRGSDGRFKHQIGTDLETVAYTFNLMDVRERQDANAALIAAAPELLGCLEELLVHIQWRRGVAGEAAGPNDCTHRAIAAITKAKGGVA